MFPVVKIPTAVSLREIEILNKLSLNKNVLEIGSLLGYSTVNIARHARKVTSIDPHEGYPYEGAESTLKKFVQNLAYYNIRNVKVFKDRFQNITKSDYDFAFIDLDGEYQTTIEALEYTKHIPIIVIHDYDRQQCPGVARAIKETGANIVQVVDTCAIIENIS